MAIEKKLICFARLAEFERQLAAGNILDYSIVFIQDAKKIWNRGTYYDCSGSSDAALYGDGYINSEVRDDGTYLKTNVADNLGAVSARGQLADALDVKTFVADAIPSNVSELNNDSSYTPYDQVVSMLSSYVKKETGKGLSTQDFTTELEGKLKGIEANAQKNVQSDWNENDRGSDAYVNNRTHYSYDIEQVTSFSIASKNEGDILVTGLLDGAFYRIYNDAGGNNEAFHFVEGRKVVIPSNGPTIEAVCAYEDDFCLKLTTPTYGMTESFVLKEVYVEQLDDVYIPETIARKAEIATINGQSLTEGGDITIEGGSLTESDIAAMGFTKNTGTYSKPSTGIPKSDLASAVQTSLGKADTALQSYTEQYKGTVTGVKINGTTKSPSSGVVDLGTVITDVSNLATKDEVILKDVTGELVTVQTQALYGGGSVYALPDTANGDEDDILLSSGSVKTINGQSILGSGDIEISGGEGGAGVYITPFTIEEFCTGYVELTDEQVVELTTAASQNRIIGMPKVSDALGYTVASYEYYPAASEEDPWSLHLRVIHNGASYSNVLDSYHEGVLNTGKLTIEPLTPLTYSVAVEDGVANVSDEPGYADDCTFWVGGECTELYIYLEPSGIGKTVRFFTGESCMLEFAIPVYWANGDVPAIEPYTHYELSLVANMEGVFNAVLTPFKPVE